MKIKRLILWIITVVLLCGAASAEVWEPEENVSLPDPEALLEEQTDLQIGTEEEADLSAESGDGSAEQSESETGQEAQTGEDPISEEETEPAADPVGFAADTVKIGLKEERTLQLTDGVSPQSAGVVFTSSNKKIVKVGKRTGKITGRKRGEATITMTASDGTVSTCKVKVVKAPKSVTLSAKKLTLGVNEEFALTASVNRGSVSALRFSSSKKRVVKVDADGHLVALKKGTAKVTVKTYNGHKAVCKVTVKAAPRSVRFAEDAVQLWEGDGYTAKPELSKNSTGAYILTSGDESVVTVQGNTLQAMQAGTAVITVTTYNGKSDEMVVTVNRRPVYRALLIGESTFPGTKFCNLPAAKDVALMREMLKNTEGALGGDWIITTEKDRTAAQINKDILKAFSDAQEGDVSLFYISTHGDEVNSFDSDTPEYTGYLVTYPDQMYDNWYERYVMTLPCLASWLKDIPGQVIVILDSCGSGAAVYGANANGTESGSDTSFEPSRFDNYIVKTFRALDKGTLAVNDGAFVVTNKFYVLTSTGYQETCWTCDGKYSYFTKWLTDGVGTEGRMAADIDKDRTTTLDELYKYIAKRGKGGVTTRKGTTSSQHVQVYPASSDFALFYR